jgi:hypothetical protein
VRVTDGNIGPRQAALRRRVGLVALLAAVVGSAWTVAAGVPRPWRLMVLPAFTFGLLGLEQARTRVCVALAARGQCDRDGGPEPVGDASLVHAWRALSRRTWLLAIAGGALLTAIVLALPG